MKSKILALAAILFCAVMLTSCDDSLEKRVLGTWMTTSVDEMPWSVTIKDVTKTEMTWIGPETGKDVVLTKQ